MDFTTILCGVIALGSMAGITVALWQLAKTVRHGNDRIAALAVRKPYWVIEQDDQGRIESIHKLEGDNEELRRQMIHLRMAYDQLHAHANIAFDPAEVSQEDIPPLVESEDLRVIGERAGAG